MERMQRNQSILERVAKPLSRAVLVGSLVATTGTSRIDFEQVAHVEEQRLENDQRKELQERIEEVREQVREHPELIMENDAEPEGEAVVSMIVELPDTTTELPRVLSEAIKLDPAGIAMVMIHKYSDKKITPTVLRLTLPQSANVINTWCQRIYYQPWSLKLLEDAALYSPGGVKGSWNHPGTRSYLYESKRPEIQTLISISDNTSGEGRYSGEYPYTALLLDDIVKGNLTIEQAKVIARNKTQLFERITDIVQRPGHLASEDIKSELMNIALVALAEINRLHESDDVTRFHSIEKVGPQALYSLIVLGESEVFTSTFNGLFNRMMKKIDSGKTLLEHVQYDHFRTFIKMVAGYGRLNDFLQTMKPDESRALLEKFIGSLETEPNMLAQASVVADMITQLGDPVLLDDVRKLLKKEYERVRRTDNKRAKLLYGILVGVYGEKVKSEEEWISKVTDTYKISDIGRVMPEELFTKEGKNIQRYFFYNDPDGQASYDNFISEYAHDPQWKIEDHTLFIRMISKKGSPLIVVYANKPAFEQEGNTAIEEELKRSKEMPRVIVHRGHSYHTKNTLDKISSLTSIVYLGGCGGYTNIQSVLSKVPRAHIISTKGTGTMRVNDPLLKMMNQEILQGKPIEWVAFWKKVQTKIDEEGMLEYVPPHKSISVFLKAYHQLVSEEEKVNTR